MLDHVFGLFTEASVDRSGVEEYTVTHGKRWCSSTIYSQPRNVSQIFGYRITRLSQATVAHRHITTWTCGGSGLIRNPRKQSINQFPSRFAKRMEVTVLANLGNRPSHLAACAHAETSVSGVTPIFFLTDSASNVPLPQKPFSLFCSE